MPVASFRCGEAAAISFVPCQAFGRRTGVSPRPEAAPFTATSPASTPIREGHSREATPGLSFAVRWRPPTPTASAPKTWPRRSTPPTPPVQRIHPAAAPWNAGPHNAAGSPHANRPNARDPLRDPATIPPPWRRTASMSTEASPGSPTRTSSCGEPRPRSGSRTAGSWSTRSTLPSSTRHSPARRSSAWRFSWIATAATPTRSPPATPSP